LRVELHLGRLLGVVVGLPRRAYLA
jgi:hypothetical protein